ncbi:MAG: glycerol-3-phosphate responsive antiterminator [Clostridia bacterium]|nr:glycerol-3-phosphate responsive antiterminator [Clostridia bacterium]
MKHQLLEYFDEVPIVAAAKSETELVECLESRSRVIFLLFGDLCTIASLVERVKEAGKIAIVHLDLIDGLAPKDVSVDFITERTRADGIISTKNSLIRYAHQKGLLTIQRYFLLDSRVLENMQRNSSPADFYEVLPGVMPKIIHQLVKTTGKPIIAGGMIRDKEDVMGALSAGAVAISSTNKDVWFME